MEKYILEFCQTAPGKLAEHGIKDEVSGRLKNYYSIYRKLQAQQITLDELYDLLPFASSWKRCTSATRPWG